MSNLGDSNTPVEGESFGLPAGAELTEDADGNLAIADSSGSIVLVRDETAGQWDLNNNSLTGINAINASSANVEEQSIANVAGLVFKDEEQTISSGSVTDVEFEVVDREDADIVQWDDELHQFEIQKNGLFLLRATLGFVSWDDGSRYRFRIDTPSGPDAANEDRDKRGDDQFEKPLSVIAPLSEGDVVTANVFQDTGGDLAVRGTLNSANLQIVRLA